MWKSIRMSFSNNQILYIGLGEMGYHISATLSKFYPTSVWNRTTSKAISHSSLFKTTALTGPNPFVHDISNINMIFSCLPTSKEIEKFVDLLIDSKQQFNKNLLWVDNTSGVPQKSNEIAQKLNQHNIGFIDAPVSGGKVGASSGTLAIMVGGPEDQFNKAKPVLEKLAKSLVHVGEKVGSGHAVKSFNNLLYACNVLFAFKTAQSIEQSGISTDKALQAIIASSGGSNSMRRLHHYLMNDKKIGYYFKTNLLLKDIDIAFSQVVDKENDEVFKAFLDVRKLYEEATMDDWEKFDVFDMYPYLEKNKSI